MLSFRCLSSAVLLLWCSVLIFLLKEVIDAQNSFLSLHSEKGPIANGGTNYQYLSQETQERLSGAWDESSIGRREWKPIAPTILSSTRRTFYSSRTIASILSKLVLEPGLIMIYDPDSDLFRVFMAAPKSDGDMMKTATCNPRGGIIIPLLAKLLLEQRPQRFHPSQPPWQLFVSSNDFTYTRCNISTQECANLRPWLHFGSSFRNSDVLLPQIQVMPTYDYLKCLRQWCSASWR